MGLRVLRKIPTGKYRQTYPVFWIKRGSSKRRFSDIYSYLFYLWSFPKDFFSQCLVKNRQNKAVSASTPWILTRIGPGKLSLHPGIAFFGPKFPNSWQSPPRLYRKNFPICLFQLRFRQNWITGIFFSRLDHIPLKPPLKSEIISRHFAL
jgi:hypothetical protein